MKPYCFRSSLMCFLAASVLAPGFLQAQEGEPAPAQPDAPIQISLGRDSPNLGGNTFRDAFISVTLSSAPGTRANKVTSEITFPDSGEVKFERAELTPDAEAGGAKLEVQNSVEGDQNRLTLTLSSGQALPDGIVANIVFKVTKELTPDVILAEGEAVVTLQNEVTAWDSSGGEIADASGGPGSIDLAYAPVVFACLFYMH